MVQPRLTCNASAGVRRPPTLEALIAEIDGEQVKDFIMGNPRPVLERAFEDQLWNAGFKNAFSRVAGEAVQIMFDFEAQPPPRFRDIAVHIRRIAAGVRPGESCGTIFSTQSGNPELLTWGERFLQFLGIF